jgi:DNA-directed RNA polymerase III subunit RPC1
MMFFDQALEDLSLRYDNSVRNSENTVVQFTYGDDSLNPEKMENNDRPVDFDRLHLSITQLFPCAEEPCLLGQQLTNKVEQALDTEQFQSLLPKGKMFLDEITSFFEDIVKRQDATIESCEEDLVQQRIWNSCRFTGTQIAEFLKIALTKYTTAMVEPGEAVGATGAQSISEPGTQMTLKVSYHEINEASEM